MRMSRPANTEPVDQHTRADRIMFLAAIVGSMGLGAVVLKFAQMFVRMCS